MPYEVFKRTAARVETPTLAITTDGRIAVNAAAVRILLEAGVKSVLLLWDEASSRMALKATAKGDKNAYAVSITPDRHSGSLRATSFLSHIGWNASRRERLPATWDQKEKMLEIELPRTHLKSSRSQELKSVRSTK